MWRVTLEGLRTRWVRLAFTGTAIVLGVAFVAGTFVLTDALSALLDDELSRFSTGDVVVRSSGTLDSGVGGDRARVPAETVDIVRQAPGVVAAEGVLVGPAQLVAPDGGAVEAAIPLGMSWGADEHLSVLELADGERPTADGEIAVDTKTARDHDIDVGDTVGVLFFGPAEDFEVVGLADFAGSSGRAFSTVAAFDPLTAQRVFGAEGQFDLISVDGTEGLDPEELRGSVAGVLPPDLEAVTSEELGEESSATLRQSLSFVGVLLLVFAGVGLIVGAFVIHNTFAMLVGQRTRELGLLRAVGATGRQVWTSVLLEAFIVGALASAIGIALGFAVARLLAVVLETVGLEVPRGQTVLQARTLVVAMAVGVGVTLIATAWPARRAARIAPVEAMREGLTTREGQPGLHRRGIVGATTLVLGLVLMLAGVVDAVPAGLGVLGDPRAAAPLGAAISVAGILVLAPAMVGGLARFLGAPISRFAGVDGRLARRNAQREPRRTAATAASLLIGTCLVTFVSLLAGSANASVSTAIDDGLEADWVLTGPPFAGFSPQVVDELAAVDEVDVATGFRLGFASLGNTVQALYSVDPEQLPEVVDLDILEGSVENLADGGVLVQEQEAEDFGLSVGDRVLLGFPTGFEEVDVAGVYRRNGFTGNFVVNILMGDAFYDARYGEELDAFAYVSTAPGVSEDEARSAIDEVLADFPNVDLLSRDEFKADQHDQVNRVLVLFYMLLALAVLVAVFGVVNTLLLSVHERRREIGLLRTVGMSRRQVAAMIRWESLLIAVLGAVTGIVTGVVIAWAVVSTLSDDGITDFVFQPLTLGVLLVAGAVVGVAAGALPARRAARADVLEAIAEE